MPSINIPTTQVRTNTDSYRPRVDIYRDLYQPEFKQRWAMAYQEGIRQQVAEEKTVEQQLAYRAEMMKSIDAQIKQYRDAKKDFDIKLYAAKDDATAQAITAENKERLDRLNQVWSARAANAVTGRTISAAHIQADGYSKAQVWAEAKRIETDDRKSRIQGYDANAKDEFINQDNSQVVDPIEEFRAGKGDADSAARLTSGIKNSMKDGVAPINTMAKQTAEIQDHDTREITKQVNRDALTSDSDRALFDQVMQDYEDQKGYNRTTVGSPGSPGVPFDASNYREGYVSTNPNDALPEAQGDYRGSADARKQAAVDEAASQTAGYDEAIAQLEAQRAGLATDLPSFTPQNGIDLARDIYSSRFGINTTTRGQRQVGKEQVTRSLGNLPPDQLSALLAGIDATRAAKAQGLLPHTYPAIPAGGRLGTFKPQELLHLAAGVPSAEPFPEAQFQQWYREQAAKTGIDPNPDSPEHHYDYRAAFKAGAQPNSEGHWPSEFKTPDHPRRYIGGVDTSTGQRMTFEQQAVMTPEQRLRNDQADTPVDEISRLRMELQQTPYRKAIDPGLMPQAETGAGGEFRNPGTSPVLPPVQDPYSTPGVFPARPPARGPGAAPGSFPGPSAYPQRAIPDEPQVSPVGRTAPARVSPGTMSPVQRHSIASLKAVKAGRELLKKPNLLQRKLDNDPIAKGVAKAFEIDTKQGIPLIEQANKLTAAYSEDPVSQEKALAILNALYLRKAQASLIKQVA